MTPTQIAVRNMSAIFTALIAHNLDASSTAITNDYSCVVWEDGFNKTRKAEILCFNSGQVVGTVTDSDDASLNKIWWVSDLCPLNPVEFDDILLLTLDESLEFVRHSIWANHNV